MTPETHRQRLRVREDQEQALEAFGREYRANVLASDFSECRKEQALEVFARFVGWAHSIESLRDRPFDAVVSMLGGLGESLLRKPLTEEGRAFAAKRRGGSTDDWMAA